MSYSHLSIIECGQPETLHQSGWPTREIGQILGLHHSVIARKIKRESKNQAYDT
ncbi:helix-turn-helix domain-containing protein [Paenibacillus odorifer]|uniref:helix-turn-helix domain-containing protein n=1 Tax=Paenibacillus odorifer TaxID=189426 RepID=UPI0009D723F4|nr:helix-turn-helix domain-containing protein [Paenibacillus odorifer]